MSAFKDMAGLRFGRLTALEPVENFDCGKYRKWKCVCDCGAVVEIRGSHMRAGRSKSCGCLNAEMTKARSIKHGQSQQTSEYKTWLNIRLRCYDPKHISFKWYGARGIKVHPSWMEFDKFFSDMGKKPTPRHSIDRYPNNDGDYAPGNCRWATSKEQANNRRKRLVAA